MVSNVEKSICILMRSILHETESGSELSDLDSLNEVLSLLEIYITIELRKKYAEWEYEGLDGIYCGSLLKISYNEFRFIGMCVLTSDQSVIPIYAHFKISESGEKFELMNCMLGENGKDGIIKTPFESNQWRKKLYAFDSSLIDWVYSISS